MIETPCVLVRKGRRNLVLLVGPRFGMPIAITVFNC